MAGALPTADHPFTGIMNAARKVVFSRTLRTAEWANTTIAAGDTTEEIDKLRRGGDGHVVVWGGVSFWRSLMWLDLIDEFRLDLHPYVAGEGTRLFDDVPKSYRLDLVSSTEFSNGTVGRTTAGTATWRRSQSRAERWFCEPVKSIENRTDGEWCELRSRRINGLEQLQTERVHRGHRHDTGGGVLRGEARSPGGTDRR
jgi:dihydrofolate reductase